jgi:tol-pal system protein YbgF
MRLPFGFTLVLMLAALPAQAQRTSLADRVTALESQAAAQTQGAGQANMELLNRTTQMQDEIRALRAIIEQLQNDLEQARQRNREQYIDMDSRVSALEGGTAKPAVVAPAPAPAKPAASAKPAAAASGENAAYQTAYNSLIKQGDATAAASQFQSFLQTYPDSRLAPNAWYWLGESYYATASYELALKSFGILLERFSDSGKAPDALLKSAYCHLEMKDTAQGKQQLERVIALYPEHPVAEMARSRLRGLSLGQ